MPEGAGLPEAEATAVQEELWLLPELLEADCRALPEGVTPLLRVADVRAEAEAEASAEAEAKPEAPPDPLPATEVLPKAEL